MFENTFTKGAFRDHKSKKDRQYNDKKKRKTAKGQTTNYKTLHRKVKTEQHKTK